MRLVDGFHSVTQIMSVPVMWCLQQAEKVLTQVNNGAHIEAVTVLIRESQLMFLFDFR